VKFAGNYHGHSDTLLAAGGSGIATLGLPGSAGVPPAAVADTVVVPYNVVPEIGDGVACVVVEPVAANMGLVPPAPGFLQGLREACDRAGALLVFDEVITGFRVGRGGAQERFGVTPDLTTLGKVLGGGLPLAAFGGRADVMAHLAPDGPVYQAGTLSGNPLATAAGLAVLDQLDAGAYAELEEKVTRFAGLLDGALPGVHVVREATLLGLFFGDAPPVDYDQARACDEKAYAAFFHAMLDRGVALAPGAYEVAFVGLAHDDGELERVAELAAGAIADA
jgi:glutamate-1-semialdehyde 2,1-aminomutase